MRRIKASGRRAGPQPQTFRDKVQSDEVLHDGLVVSVDEVADGFNHAVLDVTVDLCHQPKVQDGQPAVRSLEHVACNPGCPLTSLD